MNMFKNGQSPKILVNMVLALYILGIILGRQVDYQPETYGLWCGGLVILLVVTMGLAWARYRLAWVIMGMTVLLVGMLRFSAVMNIDQQDIGQWVDKDITLMGELAASPVLRVDDQGKKHIKYTVQCNRLILSGQELDTHGKIILYARDNSYDEHKGLLQGTEAAEEQYGRSGDIIRASGRLMRLHDYQNPGRMDMVMANRSQGIHGQMSAAKYSIELMAQDKDLMTRWAEQIRHLYKLQMDRVMPKEDSAAIFAMLFGGYGGIKPELLEAFTVTGLIHILSVSGSHITLMAGTANVIGRALGLSGGLTSVLATIIIGLYSLLAGGTTPVLRSAIMGVLTIMALTMGREKDARHLLSITALGILLIWPLSLYDISFQLSFGATAGLLYLSPSIGGLLRKYLWIYVADSLGVTLGAQLAVLPLLAWYFNVVSLSSLLANLVVAPVVEIIIVIGLLAGVLVGVVPVVGQFVFIAASLLLGIAYELSRLIAKLPGSQVYLPTFGVIVWGIYYGGLFVLTLSRDRRSAYWTALTGLWHRIVHNDLERRLVYTGMAAAVIVCLLLHCLRPNEMQVHFIDVGQGDAALVVTPHGHAFMIDTGGTRQGGYDIGSRVDVPYLLHYGIRKLDFIMLTHAHDDHAQGVGGIVDKLPVGAIMIGHEGREAYMKTFGGTHQALKREPMVVLKEGAEMTLDGVRIQVLYAPAENLIGGNTGNEFSNLIRVSYGQQSFLFTGDLAKEHEQILCKGGTALHSTVLKVGHHGSNTSSSEEFLRAVNPQWSVISVGYGNSFGHPKPEILARIHNCTNSRLLRTDKHGAIVFTTDGEQLRVNTQVVYDKGNGG